MHFHILFGLLIGYGNWQIEFPPFKALSPTFSSSQEKQYYNIRNSMSNGWTSWKDNWTLNGIGIVDFYMYPCPCTYNGGTMLQNLSKCEVKAWLCWNLIILPTLWFYVKSNFSEIKRSINVIFGNFRDSEHWNFGEFGTWKLLNY